MEPNVTTGFWKIRTPLFVFALLSALAASSARLYAAPPHAFVTRAATATFTHTIPVVYAVVSGNVAVYNALTGTLIRTIGGFPIPAFRIAAAPTGDLYVGAIDSRTSKTQIYAFHAGASSPYAIIDENPSYNLEIAAAGDGEFAVVRDAKPSFTYLIDFYEPGGTTPARTVKPGWDAIFDETYTPNGTLWVVGFDPTVNNGYGYIVPGGTAITEVPFALNPPFGPLAIDPNGNIVVPDKGRLIADTPQGQVAYIVPLQTRPRAIASIALSADGKRIFVCDPNSQIEAYDYPAGGRPKLVFGTYSTAIATGSIPG